MTIPNLVGIQMYYIPPEIVDPEATPIYRDWDSDNIIDTVGNRNQFDASTNPDNVLIYRWNMEYQEGYEPDTKNYFWLKNESEYDTSVNLSGDGIPYYRILGERVWSTENSLPAGQTLQIMHKGRVVTGLSCGQRYSVGGNIFSLLYGEDFENHNSFPDSLIPAKGRYGELFKNQTNLIDASALILPDVTENKCYMDMFYGCTSLTEAPELPATTLANLCYQRMFGYCSSLTKAPELPALNLSKQCYYNMFQRCTSLTEAPELPATTLADHCYAVMFGGCTSLTEAPELPATTLAEYCYQYMFNGCTSLTEAPVLPALTLVSHCYDYMFGYCSNLNYIKAMFTTQPSTSYTNQWVYNVAASGTFVKNSAATWNSTGINSVPSGWTVQTASS